MSEQTTELSQLVDQIDSLAWHIESDLRLIRSLVQECEVQLPRTETKAEFDARVRRFLGIDHAEVCRCLVCEGGRSPDA